MAAKPRRLGRGLDSLISMAPTDGMVSAEHQIKQIPVQLIKPGRYQPRKQMDDQSLAELAASIRAQGVIQPIVLRHISPSQYELIAGERRWRAAQMAGMTQVSAIIKDVPDEAALAMSLIENIQREDLNAMDESRALRRLMDEFTLTHQAVAEAVGKSRASVSNILRLINLQADVQQKLENADIELGHAKVLLSLDGPLQTHAADIVVKKRLSVRETENLVKRLSQQQQDNENEDESQLDPDIVSLQNRLSSTLGAEVLIQHSSVKGKGKLVIRYASLDELDGILAHIK